MLNIENCKKTLNKNEEFFTEDDVKKIRECLYKMARIIVEIKKEK